jgi:hypothetical protein
MEQPVYVTKVFTKLMGLVRNATQLVEHARVQVITIALLVPMSPIF